MQLTIPTNQLDFERTYGSEEACRQAIFNLRWPDGFVCRACESKGGAYACARRFVFECKRCGAQTSGTAGTLFHATKLPLTTLFRIIYMIVAEKHGTNAKAIARQIGVSYNTAELWLRKTRAAMVREGREQLSGRVEVDETMIGGPAWGCGGRALGPNQAWVVIYVEDLGDEGFGRIRLKHVERANAQHLHESVRSEVERGSTLHTDSFQGYRRIEQSGYDHERETIGDPKRASERFPGVHRVASLLKRWMLGALQGSWSACWLQSMLDEFVFRFNRRKSRCRPLLFNRVLESGGSRRSPTRQALAAYAHSYPGSWW